MAKEKDGEINNEGLKDDVKGNISKLGDEAGEVARKFKNETVETQKAIVDYLKEKSSEIKIKASELNHKAVECIETHPWQSIGVAVLVASAVTFWLCRR